MLYFFYNREKKTLILVIIMLNLCEGFLELFIHMDIISQHSSIKNILIQMLKLTTELLNNKSL